MDIRVYMSYQINSCGLFKNFFGSILGIFGSYRSSMFSFLRNFYTIVHSGQHYTSNNSVVGVPFFHILVNSWFLSCVLIKAFLIGVRWYFIAVLICISLMVLFLSIFSCACWPSACLLWKMPMEILHLSLKSLIYFEYAYMVWEKNVHIILFHADVQFSQHHLRKRAFSPIVLPPLCQYQPYFNYCIFEV